MNGPTVTVIIPFCGSVDLLQRALESVRDQTFTGEVETIVVVDGSAEDLGRICTNFPGVQLIYQENAGPGVARNRGIEEASGEFIAFLDADDYWLPTKLTVQVDAMRRHGSAWSQHSYLVVTPDGEVLRHIDTHRYSGNVVQDTLLSFRVQTSTVMVRRESVEDSTRRFGVDRVGEDGLFYFRMASSYPLTAVGEALGHFTWHGANAGGRADFQLWSRARTWEENRDQVKSALPILGQVAYQWCALAVRLLRYPQSDPPGSSNTLWAQVFYAPSYVIFQNLARRLHS